MRSITKLVRALVQGAGTTGLVLLLSAARSRKGDAIGWNWPLPTTAEQRRSLFDVIPPETLLPFLTVLLLGMALAWGLRRWHDRRLLLRAFEVTPRPYRPDREPAPDPALERLLRRGERQLRSGDRSAAVRTFSRSVQLLVTEGRFTQLSLALTRLQEALASDTELRAAPLAADAVADLRTALEQLPDRYAPRRELLFRLLARHQARR